MEILAPISIGELYDKITILEIKMANIKDTDKLRNVSNELLKLNDILKNIKVFSYEFDHLKLANESIWEVEDKIRKKEYFHEFDEEFIELARKVYFLNDSRAKIKKKINFLYGSEIVEEKSYEKY